MSLLPSPDLPAARPATAEPAPGPSERFSEVAADLSLIHI